MVEDVGLIETGVDDLLKLLKSIDKISIQESAKKLKVDMSILQTWVDFLVEEDIIGIEYKFITPYIYLIKKSDEKIKNAKRDPLEIKEDFYRTALQRNIPTARIDTLWRQYLSNNIVEFKDQFVVKGKARGLDERTIEKMWNKYKIYLLQNNEN